MQHATQGFAELDGSGQGSGMQGAGTPALSDAEGPDGDPPFRDSGPQALVESNTPI